MLITDQRTLAFIETLKAKNVIRFDTDFCEKIGIRKQNLSKIKNQNVHFTAEQLQKVGEVFGADMNYINGFSSDPFRKNMSTPTSTSTLKNT